MAIRVGIVGLASKYWPSALAQNLNASDQAELVAVATMKAADEEVQLMAGCAKEEFGEKHGIKLYDSLEEMIQAEELDTVAIATRHTEHADHAERAAAKGVNIYICKTMATTSEDAARIVDAGRKHGVKIAVGPGGRFQPQHAVARQVIESGRIGKPLAIRISHNHGTIDAFPQGDWYREKKEGGPELSLGWYVIDVVRAISPQPVTRVCAEHDNYRSPDSPFMDQGKIVMRLEDGAIAACDMYFSNRFAYPTWDLEVIGTEAALRTHAGTPGDGVPQALLWSKDGVETLAVPKGSFWTEDTAAWVGAFAAGREAEINAEEGRIITEVTLACWESAKRKAVVELG